MAYALNGSVVEERTSNQLQTKVIFDRVEIQTKKRPESSTNSGIDKLDSVLESCKMDADNSILPETPNSYKDYGESVSNISIPTISNYIQLNRCEATFWLMANHPNAYLLLNLVALRAQRTPNAPSGLVIGEALIGDYESTGSTRQQYRTALATLVRMKYLTISETCRTRKKSATATTTVGTKVKLLNSEIWNINPETTNHPINHRPTTDQPPTNHEQESKLSISSISHTTMSSSQAQSTKVPEKIFFDWEEMKLKGIESSDIETWKATFTHVDVPEYLKFIEQDIGAKPTKYKKRKQIVKTILIYFQNKNENNIRYQKTAKQPFQKPESLHNKPFNKDTSPKKYNNTYDFSKT